MLLGRGLQWEAEKVRLCRLALWCPCCNGVTRDPSGVLALMLSACLCSLQGLAESVLLCFSWEAPKSQSSGSVAPAEGSVGSRPLKEAQISWGEEARGLLSLS